MTLARKIRGAVIVGGFAVACRPGLPNEAPPMGPRPEPVQPTSDRDRDNPVPGAPDPIPPFDGGVSSVVEAEPVVIGAAAPKPKAPDAGVAADAPVPPDAPPPPPDAGIPLPPVPDGGLPPDANRRAD